jgi:hypothetical protein
MSILEVFDIDLWSGPFGDAVRERAIAALEGGRILFFPRLPFSFLPDEQILLSPRFSDGKAKNISLDPAAKSLKGTVADGERRERLQRAMERFAQSATRLVCELFPAYAPVLKRARTSYRPVEIAGRRSSRRKDDTLLHIDAFPSRPVHGQRILRLFCNVDPGGQPRRWHVGEPFEDFSRKFHGQLRQPSPLAAWLLARVGITKGRRSAYDDMMLKLHDAGKRDQQHQQSGIRETIAFPAGTTWLCFTDQVLHAALAGQFALEQTFHVDVRAMANPERSPLRTLERLTGAALV